MLNQIARRSDTERGFTLVELLVVISIIVILMALLLPALGKAFGSAKSAEDKTKLNGIYSATVLDASGNEGQLPLPSTYTEKYPNADHDTSNTTANLMSLLLARNYFTTDYLISPVESNPNISDINAEDDVYDYNAIDGETVFWDDAFNADVSTASVAAPAHNSYAHQALCGERVRTKWNTSSTASDIIFANRGPELTSAGSSITFDDTSNTLKFHGEDSIWKGNIVSGDGSTRMLGSYIPDGIAYQPLNGMPLGPDNIFMPDWNDVQVAGVPAGMPSADNWIVICTEVINENQINVVWD